MLGIPYRQCSGDARLAVPASAMIDYCRESIGEVCS